MQNNQDIESCIIRMGLRYESPSDGTWVIHVDDGHVGTVVVRHEPPVLVLRVKVMDLPRTGDVAGLMRTLLQLNATEMLGAAYGIEAESVVAVQILQSGMVDAKAFEEAVDGLALGVGQHLVQLSGYVEHGVKSPAGRRGSA
jgi:hypothetical protein